MTTLSPAATFVENAAYEAWVTKDDPQSIAAAALRAAADQVVPPDPYGDDCCIDLSIGIRADLLAIAAELDGTTTTS